ncbi:MAG: SLC13 family permease [Massilimicrobiota timonensis]
MRRIWGIIKKDTVLMIAWILAMLSCFFVKPSFEYLGYIDYTTLALLFCLMVIVNGLQNIQLFQQIAIFFMKKIKTTRQLDLLLVGLCFLLSMLITNDVALITFVPLTIVVLKILRMEERVVHIVVLQTLSANLGSMCTPIGNPQNLFLYTYFDMSLSRFMIMILPFVMLSLILLLIHIFMHRNQSIETPKIYQKEDTNITYLWIYMILFVLCILSVLHLLSIFYLLPVIMIVCGFMDYKTIVKVDYLLLLTFVGFFIFIGNLKNINMIAQFLNQIVNGYEMIISVICSQVFSNVPTAILLSGFTKNVYDLLIGVNIGGLGTFIASMASLISYKYITRIYPQYKKRYFMSFTKYNIIDLIVLVIAAEIFLLIV